jgi:LSD1 subclass zinc finger protein
MAVQIVCPSLKCRKLLSVPNDVRGKVVRCQYCQTMLRVPEARKPEAVGGKSGK